VTLRRRLVVAVALASLSLVGFPGVSSGDTYRIRATGDSPSTYRWTPDFRHIIKGDRVVWRNPTSVSHRVVAYRGRWSKNTTIGPGETTRKRFRRTGTYKYRCTVPGHSTLSADESNCDGMCGVVHVTR
jgi:plastocyanin